MATDRTDPARLVVPAPCGPPSCVTRCRKSSELKPVALGAREALLWPPLTSGWSPGPRGHPAPPRQDAWRLQKNPVSRETSGERPPRAPWRPNVMSITEGPRGGYGRAKLRSTQESCSVLNPVQVRLPRLENPLGHSCEGRHVWGWQATTKVPYTVWFLCAIPYGRSHRDKNYPINKGCRIRLCNLLNNW